MILVAQVGRDVTKAKFLFGVSDPEVPWLENTAFWWVCFGCFQRQFSRLPRSGWGNRYPDEDTPRCSTNILRFQGPVPLRPHIRAPLRTSTDGPIQCHHDGIILLSRRTTICKVLSTVILILCASSLGGAGNVITAPVTPIFPGRRRDSFAWVGGGRAVKVSSRRPQASI